MLADVVFLMMVLFAASLASPVISSKLSKAQDSDRSVTHHNVINHKGK